MATVWVALVAEAVVLLAVAGAMVKWVNKAQSGTPDQAIEPVGPVAERIA
ncbi:hypothetical protein SAMN02982929_01508 [Saccharopolyspora kobensis]|uniref:Uncharacterized protein n=1 Tax=Saccharopolyspora kobensis TaxID=146035 RepID=A0A1H5XF77_9PSEU|nr:hypothetical protein SAMN02982929_01508 [Saccharopolyspora kobensis]SFE43468.1 hypothetical protein SAMN05216506_111116 [Saccharopolyspora kobensis]